MRGYRAALNNPNPRQATTGKRSVPAPYGGWNTRDDLDAMPATDAVIMDDLFPTIGGVEVRKGYEEFADGMGTNVDMLAEYHSGSIRRFIAAGDGNLWNITSGGTASSIGSGYSSNQWQHANFSGKIFLVNGTDAPKDWDGTTLSSTSWSGSGLTISDLDGIFVFKNRLFFWDSSTADFWYAAVDAITGTLTQFPLSRVSSLGGNLVNVGSWTFDGGDGIDDYIVFIMSSGEMIVYSGIDPGNDFLLVGKYKISQPVNIRGAIKYAGDLVVITETDYLPASQAKSQTYQASKLSGAVKTAVGLNSGFGWQALHYENGNMLIFNHPAGSTYHQHIVNTKTLAATRFTGYPARCFGVYDGELYFGSTDGKVYKADTGYNDDGSAIFIDCQQAHNNFGTAQTKQAAAVRFVTIASSVIDVNFGIGSDYTKPAVGTPSATATASGSLWDVALWDVSLWEQSEKPSTTWEIAAGVGQSLSHRIRFAARQKVTWVRTDYMIEAGTNL